MTTENFAPVFEGLGLSEADQYLIAPFFTNLDKAVYGCQGLSPEVIGALCSRASRAKDDLRLALLNEYIKPFLTVNENEVVEKLTAAGKSPVEIGTELLSLERYARDLQAFIDFLHQHPADQIFNNPKAREFYIKWLAQFGDDSIAQMSGTHLVYTGISQLAIKQIEDMRLGIAPIEKSTRYVDYSSKVDGSYRYYTDPTLASYGLLDEYKRVMDNLFDTYTQLLAEYQAFLRSQFPTEEERVIKTKAFDTVRLILPVSTLSQLALFGNGQAFEYMINRGLDHNLGEIRWSAKSAMEELNHIIPAFLRRVESEAAADYRKYMTGRGSRVKAIMQEFGFKEKADSSNPVTLFEYDAAGEDKIIAGMFYPESHMSYAALFGWVRGLSSSQKEAVLAKVLEGRKARYYKIPRAFELTDMKFEIVMNIGAWRDLHRHRTQTQMRQRFTIEHGLDVPEGLKEAGLDGKYISAVKQAEELFAKLEKLNPDMAQYCCVFGHRVRFLQCQNPRAFFWEAEIRTTSQGHPDYRKIEQEKARQFQRAYPLLGKHLMVDFGDYDFARRKDSAVIAKKEEELAKALTK